MILCNHIAKVRFTFVCAGFIIILTSCVLLWHSQFQKWPGGIEKRRDELQAAYWHTGRIVGVDLLRQLPSDSYSINELDGLGLSLAYLDQVLSSPSQPEYGLWMRTKVIATREACIVLPGYGPVNKSEGGCFAVMYFGDDIYGVVQLNRADIDSVHGCITVVVDQNKEILRKSPTLHTESYQIERPNDWSQLQNQLVSCMSSHPCLVLFDARRRSILFVLADKPQLVKPFEEGKIVGSP